MNVKKIQLIKSCLGNIFKILAALGMVFITGCASILSDANQQMVFNSQPPGGDVFVNGMKMGTTPCNVLIMRQKPPPPIIIKKDGYQDTPVVFTSKINPLVFGNVLFGYFSTTAFPMDLNSPQSIVYFPDTIMVMLQPNESDPDANMKKESNKVIRFVLTNYNDLLVQASNGKGEHLNTLAQLLNIPEQEKDNFISEVKKIFIENDDPAKVARTVLIELNYVPSE